MRSKSSILHFTPAALAMARKWSTVLVEPPVAITSATAFSIDFLVMMSRGLRSLRTASARTRADSAAESAFSGSGDAICDEPSRLMPSASKEDDIGVSGYCRRGGSRAGGQGPHPLERAHDRELLPFPETRLDGAGIDEDTGHVHARDRHHASRHVLVAAADGNYAGHALPIA